MMKFRQILVSAAVGMLLLWPAAIAVRAAPQPPPAAKAPETKAPEKTDKVDLNAATAEQLQELPGIGEANAKKIIAGRPYKSVEDLSKAGLPASTVEKITPLVVVERAETAARTPPQKGMVWCNTESKVFHKEGSRWYGKTQDGKWMTEAAAVKDGFRPAKDE